ncbi:hypothetical protein M8C21_019654, partial [Ambrosia artemisiifolia]
VTSLSKTVALLVLLLATLTTLALGQGNRGGSGGTRLGFYRSTCPRVESIVQSAVRSAVRANPTIAPGLLRMFFHDCFTGGRSWQVRLGRRDGLISQASDTANLPAFNDHMSVQINKFADKGLNTQDLVTLVGGHTIGTSACALFSYRLYNFNNTNGPDPEINPTFLPQLRALCPNGGDALRRVALDTGSANSFGNSFYENLRNGRGVIESDAKLWSDRRTRRFVQRYLGGGRQTGSRFNAEFGRAMVKMGNIEVKTGTQGEIRRVCT